MAGLQRRLSFSNVVSLVALFIALGGTGYAVTAIDDNSVASRHVVDDSLLSRDLRTNQVNSTDVRNDDLSGGGLRSNDIAADALTGADVADTGSLGTAEIDESSLFNDNSITGADVADTSSLGGPEINESALGQVPSAAQASTATGLRFQNIHRVAFIANNGSGISGFGNYGDLNLSVTCNNTTGDLTLQVSSDLDNASLAVSDDDSFFDVKDLDSGTNVDILTPLGGDSNEVINLVYVNGNTFSSPLVDTVTMQLHVRDEAPAGTQAECIVAGHAFASNVSG